MELIKVNSSNLHSVGYEESTQTLILIFRNGAYEYSNVPKLIYEGLMNASSKGKYTHKFINGKFPFKKISRNSF